IAGFDDADKTYVAMPRVVAALNTPETRELEHSLTLLLAAHVARLPDVHLVEREEMDRLVLERSEPEAKYQGSHWLLDASVTAPTSAPDQLVAEASRVVSEVFGKKLRGTWDAKAEARAFLIRAKRFERIFLWKEAGAAAEAAWALGLRTDEVMRLRLNSSVQ